jgi:hypothetical protein
MGFYALGAIQPIIARILDQRPESVTFDTATIEILRDGTEIDRRIAEAIAATLKLGIRTEGLPYRVFVLSRNKEEGSVTLNGPIMNTTKAASGRTWAWTLAQRYTRIGSLVTPGISTTADLEAVGG